MNAGACRRPLPSGLAIATLPARAASTSPGTPKAVSGRSSSGSQRVVVRRAAGSRRPAAGRQRLQVHAVVANGEIAALTSV